MSDAEREAKNPWPYAIMGAIAGIILLQVAVVSVATANRPVLEDGAANGYVSSLTWDDERAAYAAARALEWRLALGFEGDAVDYRLSKAGHPVEALEGTVSIVRADGRAEDRALAAEEVAPGTYRVSRAGLPAGRYRLRAELRRGDARWLDDRWVMLP